MVSTPSALPSGSCLPESCLKRPPSDLPEREAGADALSVTACGTCCSSLPLVLASRDLSLPFRIYRWVRAGTLVTSCLYVLKTRSTGYAEEGLDLMRDKQRTFPFYLLYCLKPRLLQRAEQKCLRQRSSRATRAVSLANCWQLALLCRREVPRTWLSSKPSDSPQEIGK